MLASKDAICFFTEHSWKSTQILWSFYEIMKNVCFLFLCICKICEDNGHGQLNIANRYVTIDYSKFRRFLDQPILITVVHEPRHG